MSRIENYYPDRVTKMTVAERLDHYQAQIDFWKSVVAKYPRPGNRTQLNYMRLKHREYQKQ